MTAPFVRWPAAAVAGVLWAAAAPEAIGATLSSESSVGVSADYASNPFLLSSGARAAESLAVLANLPATYTTDTQTFDLTPRLRFAETHGPVALLSNYQYVDADWRWSGVRDTLTVNADWHHDSTYYNQFENVALLGHDLRRSEQIGSLAWQHQLTERAGMQLTGSWDKVNYSQKSASSLINFSYAQGAAEYDYALSEAWQWSTSAGYAHYELLTQSYDSDERFAQTALKRTLSERWSLTAQAGYAWLGARAETLVCCEIAVSPTGGLYLVYIPIKQSASRSSPNYAVTFERRSERLTLDLGASRAIEPSGLGALLTQDDASVGVSRLASERLTLGATLHWSRLSDSLGRLSLDRHYYNGDLTASWQWTEHWTVQLQGTYTQQYLSQRIPSSSGVTIYLNMFRQFGRLRL